MHIHNLCTRNGDHFNHSIRTGNAHKIPLIFVESEKGGGIQAKAKSDGGGQMMDAFIITKLKYLVVRLLCDLERCRLYLYLWH